MKTTALILSVIAASLCSLAVADVGVRDLNPPARVTGCLGKPLGTRMTIDGVVAERVMLANPLAVSKVDGHQLTNVVSIEIRGKAELRKGVHYRIEGYESGEFSGPPSWQSPEVQQPFQFRSFFVATKIIEPKPE